MERAISLWDGRVVGCCRRCYVLSPDGETYASLEAGIDPVVKKTFGRRNPVIVDGLLPLRDAFASDAAAGTGDDRCHLWRRTGDTWMSENATYRRCGFGRLHSWRYRWSGRRVTRYAESAGDFGEDIVKAPFPGAVGPRRQGVLLKDTEELVRQATTGVVRARAEFRCRAGIAFVSSQGIVDARPTSLDAFADSRVALVLRPSGSDRVLLQRRCLGVLKEQTFATVAAAVLELQRDCPTRARPLADLALDLSVLEAQHQQQSLFISSSHVITATLSGVARFSARTTQEDKKFVFIRGVFDDGVVVHEEQGHRYTNADDVDRHVAMLRDFQSWAATDPRDRRARHLVHRRALAQVQSALDQSRRFLTFLDLKSY